MITLRSIYYKLAIITAAVVVFCIFSNSFGYNIITNSYTMTMVCNKISPQGWGFFADNPRKDIYHHVYRLNGTDVEDIMPVNAHWKNLCGLQKHSRMINYESGLILKQIDSTKWRKSDGTVDQTNTQFVTINNKGLHFLGEGKYAIVKTKLPPYLWRNLNNKNNCEIVYVSCSKI